MTTRAHAVPKIPVHYIYPLYTGCSKNVLIEQTLPKLSPVGLNFTMNMTWKDWIMLSHSKKRPKN